MTPDAWARVRRLFEEAVALPAAERAAFLDETCAGDDAARAEVERLLAAEPRAADFLEESRPDVSELLGEVPSDLGPGVRLGRYSLRRRIASGGMGTVWEAEQDQPKRTVALKTIRMGFATEERRQRFQLEAEVLGRLRHPGIAQIYEAGTHEDQLGSFPYFAMELVEDAKDIVTYADDGGLGRHERLALFGAVCDAIHHGHQRGIVHRDLKPGNILVDPAGQPKIIDFGLARATRLEHSITTAETAAGALLGTLLYMSPEQLEGDPEEVDTRSDVYSLGVLLYQLVAGRHPHDVEGLSIQRMIARLKDDEPRKPIGVPLDLVWVIFRALEKDPAHRYASASELAADVRRFIEHEPVLAGPPSLRYRFKKLIRRNRVAVSTASLVFLALAAGVTGVLWKASEARAEAELAVRINEFFDEMLQSPTPYALGRDVPMSTVLDNAAARIADEFPDRPEVQARIRGSIGKAYQQLGRYAEAIPHLEVALEAALDEFGEVHPTTAEIMLAYANSLRRKEELEKAEATYRRLIDLRAQLYGPEHYETSNARISLSTVLLDQGENEEASAIIEELVDVLPTDESKAAQHVAVSILNNYTTVLLLAGETDEAIANAEATMEYAAEHLGEEDPYTALAYGMYANRMFEAGRPEEAEEFYRLALDLMEQTLGESDFDRVVLLNNYGYFLVLQGRPEEAVPFCRTAYDGAKAVQSRHLGAARGGLVRALARSGRDAEAAEILRRDLDESESKEDRRRIAAELAQILERNDGAEEAAELRARYGG